MPEPIVRFAAGAEIPEWLLVREPKQRHAPRGVFRFASPVRLVDMPETYLLMLEAGEVFIDDTGMEAHVVYAASKPVALVRTMSVIQGLGPAEVVGALPPMFPVGATAVPDPHRSFWARLKYVLGLR